LLLVSFDPEDTARIFFQSVRELFDPEERDTNSKTSTDFYQNTWRHIEEDITVYTHNRENLRSNKID
jgi:hypothetical protein